MTTSEPEQHSPDPQLTPLPRLEDLPRTRSGGYEPEAVREMFEGFHRHAVQLQT
jgi:hypothetical protein